MKLKMHLFKFVIVAIIVFNFFSINYVSAAIDLSIMQNLEGKFREMETAGNQCTPENLQNINYVPCACNVTLNYPTPKQLIFNYCRAKADFSNTGAQASLWYLTLFSMGDLPPDVINNYWFKTDLQYLQSLNILNVDQLRTLFQDKMKLSLRGDCTINRNNYEVLEGYFTASCQRMSPPEICCCTQKEAGTETVEYTCETRKDYTCPAESQSTKFPAPPEGKTCQAAYGKQGTVTTPPEVVGISLLSLQTKAKSLQQTSFSTPVEIIAQGIKILLSFIGSIAIVLYIYAGLMWMFAAGNTERIGKSKQIFLWVSLGLLVMIGSYVIVGYLFTSLGAG